MIDPESRNSWLLRGLFARPSVNFILGAPNNKKSWLGMDLATCVALGCGWLGFASSNGVLQGCHSGQRSALQADQPLNPVPSYYLDEDLGLQETARRLHSVFKVRGATRDIPLNFTSFSRYNLLDPAESFTLAGMAKKMGAGLIVLDNPFSNKWSYASWKDLPFPFLIKTLKAISEFSNAAVLVLLHISHRHITLGSDLFALGADHVLAVDSPIGASWLHLRTLASRNLQPVSITATIRIRQPRRGKILFDPKFRDLSLSTERPKPPLGPAGYEILRRLKSGNANATELTSAIRSALPSRVPILIHELKHEGFIQRVNSGGRGAPALYGITPAGEDLV
jgi:hypothetical protein